MKWTYLLINLGSIIIPFIFSFHPKLKFSANWKSAWLAIVLALIPFIIWDAYFTAIGVWSFNHDYTLGLDILGLPLEEWLFFVCIPYASLYTYHCFKKLFEFNASKKIERIATALILSISLFAIIQFPDRIYTFTTAVLLIILMVYLLVKKVTWLKPFFITYAAILLPFFIVNGLLTGWLLDSPVVIYNNNENVGFRLNTIPVEDVFYGCLLLLLNTTIYEYLLKKNI